MYVFTVRNCYEQSQSGFTRKQSLPNFLKNEHFLPPRMCVSRGKKCLFFGKNWRSLFSCNTRFDIHPFAGKLF